MLSRVQAFLLTCALVDADLVPTEECGASSPVSLLQTQHVVTDATAGEGARHKVAWFHIPKCGTSFGTTLMHYANRSLPIEARMRSKAELLAMGKNFNPGRAVLREYPANVWFKHKTFWEKGGNVGAHDMVPAHAYAEFRGHFFGMFREPWQRMYSDWTFFGNNANPAAWMHERSGMATKMLAGQQDGLKVSSDVWPPNIDLALSRLDGFAFTGLTEHWGLSICLFHTMFGGEFHPQELENMRPSNYENTDAQRKFFEDRRNDDKDDLRLYEKASRIFWANVKKHQAQLSQCPNIDAETVSTLLALHGE